MESGGRLSGRCSVADLPNFVQARAICDEDATFACILVLETPDLCLCLYIPAWLKTRAPVWHACLRPRSKLAATVELLPGLFVLCGDG